MSFKKDQSSEPETPDRLARHNQRRAKLIAENLAMLQRMYTTPKERAAEVARLSLTGRHTHESVAARTTVLTQLYGNRQAVREYLAYLCGDDLLAWARLLQTFSL
jgi:hypothetical protein